MRDFEQRKEEIFARSKEKIARRKKHTKRIILTCLPVVLCVYLTGSFLAMGGFFSKKDSAAMENGMAMDSVAEGEMIYHGADVPGSPEMDYGQANAPDRIGLELGRNCLRYAYSEQEIVNSFLEILEGEAFPPAKGDTIRGEEFFYSFHRAPDQMLEDDEYIVKFSYPDGTITWFILRDDRLTRADGVSYRLTEDQASFLYKLMEIEWP